MAQPNLKFFAFTRLSFIALLASLMALGCAQDKSKKDRFTRARVGTKLTNTSATHSTFNSPIEAGKNASQKYILEEAPVPDMNSTTSNNTSTDGKVADQKPSLSAEDQKKAELLTQTTAAALTNNPVGAAIAQAQLAAPAPSALQSAAVTPPPVKEEKTEVLSSICRVAPVAQLPTDFRSQNPCFATHVYVAEDGKIEFRGFHTLVEQGPYVFKYEDAQSVKSEKLPDDVVTLVYESKIYPELHEGRKNEKKIDPAKAVTQELVMGFELPHPASSIDPENFAMEFESGKGRVLQNNLNSSSVVDALVDKANDKMFLRIKKMELFESINYKVTIVYKVIKK